MSKYIVFFEKSTEDSSPDQYKKEINQIGDVINRLVTKYDYSKNGAIELIKFIIKERY